MDKRGVQKNVPKCIGKGVNGCLKKAPRPWGVHIKGVRNNYSGRAWQVAQSTLKNRTDKADSRILHEGLPADDCIMLISK